MCTPSPGKPADYLAVLVLSGRSWTPASAFGCFSLCFLACISHVRVGCWTRCLPTLPPIARVTRRCRAGYALPLSRLTSWLPRRCCSPPTRCWCGDGGACGQCSRETRPFDGRPPRRPCQPPRMAAVSGGAWPTQRRRLLHRAWGRLPNTGGGATEKTAGVLLREAAACTSFFGGRGRVWLLWCTMRALFFFAGTGSDFDLGPR